MKILRGGVATPMGFSAAGVAAHIKNDASTKKDCALVYSDALATLAGAFTTNRVKAAPVLWCQEARRRGHARAVFANSGNANACTGKQGLEDTRATAERLAQRLNLAPEESCILSTGVIGVPLPMPKILAAVDACVEALAESGGSDAAAAIMTTDTVPKEMAVEVALSTGCVRIGAMAKGAGMIAPNMATMLCVITTDAAIAGGPLQSLLSDCVQQSFNCMCIDNDMSTNDTVLFLANGRAGLPALQPGTEDHALFAAAVRQICIAMAQALVRDGEGAKKFVEIRVHGASSDTAAKAIARSIAMSQLCKTAFAGEDPNWGRIACAAGYAGVAFNPDALSIWIGQEQVVDHGLPTGFDEKKAAAHMQGDEVSLRVEIGDGQGAACFWTSDLSHEYVTINADYRT